MKKLILAGLAILLFASCAQQDTRYTQDSPEIDTYKKSIEDYVNQNWEAMASHYADTAKIYNNATKQNPQTISQMIETNKKDAAVFSSWSFVNDESEYEMVVTDKGHTWVNFWGLWQGRLIANDKLYEIPCHFTARFVDGKIVEEHGYWDNSKIMSDLQQLEREATAADNESSE